MSVTSRPLSSKSANKRPISSMDARRREHSFKDYETILEGLKQSFDERWKHNVAANSEENHAKFEDFDRYRTLGTGAFGRVILVKHKTDGGYHAMKILDKGKIVKMKQVDR